MNGLQPFESTIKQTTETMPLSHKTITADVMTTSRITSLRELLHYRNKTILPAETNFKKLHLKYGHVCSKHQQPQNISPLWNPSPFTQVYIFADLSLTSTLKFQWYIQTVILNIFVIRKLNVLWLKHYTWSCLQKKGAPKPLFKWFFRY